MIIDYVGKILQSQATYSFTTPHILFEIVKGNCLTIITIKLNYNNHFSFSTSKTHPLLAQ